MGMLTTCLGLFLCHLEEDHFYSDGGLGHEASLFYVMSIIFWPIVLIVILLIGLYRMLKIDSKFKALDKFIWELSRLIKEEEK